MLHLTSITVEHQDELRQLARRLERADPDVFYNDGEDGYSISEHEAALIVDALRRVAG
jgi:hypothetical protein